MRGLRYEGDRISDANYTDLVLFFLLLAGDSLSPEALAHTTALPVKTFSSILEFQVTIDVVARAPDGSYQLTNSGAAHAWNLLRRRNWPLHWLLISREWHSPPRPLVSDTESIAFQCQLAPTGAELVSSRNDSPLTPRTEEHKTA